MKGKILWVSVLVGSSLYVNSQHIIKLKDNNKPPIICYAEQKSGIHSHISAPEIFQKLKKSGARTKSANINVAYINFPAQAKTAFEYAVSIWESLISSPVTINVTAVWTNLSSGTLGAAGPSFWTSNFKGVPKFNIYYPGPIAEKLAKADLNGTNEPDIVAQFNSSINWYFQTNGTPGPSEYDFVTVVLHELGHGLGFTSTFDVDFGIGRYGEFTGGIPFPYDLFIENNLLENLYQNFDSPSNELATQLTNNNVFINTPSSTIKSRLYAPIPFNDGSSIAHLSPTANPQGTANSLMRPFINVNEVNHDPGPVVNTIFKDLGWVTTYIDHDHLDNQENISQSIPVKALIQTDGTSGYSFNTNQVFLNYALNGSTSFIQLQMMPTGTADEFSATIPAPGIETVIQYNIQVTDNLNRILTNPGAYYDPGAAISQKGPVTAYYSFYVGPDTEAPEIIHTPKAFVSYLDEELMIDVAIKESSELSSVQLEFIFNNEAPQISNFTFHNSEPDLFDGSTTYHYRNKISFTPGQLSDGDQIKYRITATDNASNANQASNPVVDYFIVPVEGLAQSRTYYVNNFNTPSDDFIGDDFTITQPAGFNDPALHSQHPYAEAGANGELNFTYQLRIPIIISDQTALMSFDEIVLIEPGEDGSVFGDRDFFDYVVTEGSSDGGQTWIPVADGYDARDNGSWLNRYNNNGQGDATLFRKRTIDLSNKFSPGDEVVFRFRLFSDPFENGWGWAIDNLTIQVDDVPPQILHNHIDYLSEDINTFSIPINVIDDLLLEKISIDFKINDGTIQHQEIEVDERDVLVNFEFDISGLTIGDIIYYRFEALDSAGNSSALPSLGYFNVPKIQFDEAVQQYANNFNSMSNDFVGNFFEIAQPGGFNNGAIHTPHPYLAGFGIENKSDFSYTLKKKIIIREDNPYIKFDEVCLVEDHVDGATFGTASFKDYVIVEASNDNGITWKPLLDGYDAKDKQEWLNAYNQDQTGSASIFKTRYINILDTDGLNAGEEIIIRFRLFTDESIQGWGWAIDNLHIQDEVTDVELSSLISDFVIYPNPVVQDKVIVEFQMRSSSDTFITIIDSQGKERAQKIVGGNPNERMSIPFDVSSYSNGLYLVRLTSKGKSETKKFIVQH